MWDDWSYVLGTHWGLNQCNRAGCDRLHMYNNSNYTKVMVVTKEMYNVGTWRGFGIWL